MLDRTHVVRELKRPERAALAKRFGIDVGRRTSEELMLAILERSDVTLDELLGALTTEQLARVARKWRLRAPCRRRELVAILGGHEAERFAEPYATWVRRLEGFGRCLDQLDSDGVYLRIGPRARVAEIRAVEELLGIQIPLELRRTVLEFSGDFHFSWHIGVHEAPGELGEVVRGGCSFGTGTLQFNNCPAREVPPEGDVGWHELYADKLLCFPDGSGDAVSFDRRRKDAMVYVSHEAPLSKPPLAFGFDDMMERWTQVACAGPDYHIIDLFRGSNGLLDPGSRNAKCFRSWLER